jgi:hypothetical protein
MSTVKGGELSPDGYIPQKTLFQESSSGFELGKREKLLSTK